VKAHGGKGLPKERSLQGNNNNCTGGTEVMLTGLERITELVAGNPDRKLQTLMHLVNVETLREVHKLQKTGKATGIDKVTKSEYEENLEENLENLVKRMKSFSYRPQPVRRTYIPKEGGKKMRPLGIPAYEDKLVQGVIAEILKEIYEPKFCESSFGYREGRGCHDAIIDLQQKLWGDANWIVDADIKGFFDNVNHEWMMRFLEHEIADKNLLRYIRRFMKAGIMEQGKYEETYKGVPQGGLISPVMANVYLHYVIDLWFDRLIRKNCKGYAEMVRYADDTVFCFKWKEDAERFYEAFKTRLAKFGLEVAEDKTKIIKFGKWAGKEAGTFDFLGFTVISGKSRNGRFKPTFHTSKKKLKAKRQSVKLWLHENMHIPVATLIAKLNLKLKGHYNYYGVSGNSKKIVDFHQYVNWQLWKTLRRRSQRDKTNWASLNQIFKYNPIALPRICVNLYPEGRKFF
jgi:group II intron reverse transcriptase/maturase